MKVLKTVLKIIGVITVIFSSFAFGFLWCLKFLLVIDKNYEGGVLNDMRKNLPYIQKLEHDRKHNKINYNKKINDNEYELVQDRVEEAT